MLSIAANVGFVAIKAPTVITGIGGICIRGSTFGHSLDLRALAAGFNQGGVHHRGPFDNIPSGFQLLVEQLQQLLVQLAFDQPLTKAANGRLIQHSLVSAELDEFLKTQPVLQLLLGLRIAQAVEVLQDHNAQQNPNSARGPSTWTVSRSQALLSFSEIHDLAYRL